MATTTNYGWTTPNDTDLVKDGAAAIRTLGSSVDTTTKALNPSTTLGDIEYRSATANTNTRLAIGTTGQVLTVAGGVPTWATSDDANAIQNALLTTTGDTIYASAASTPARLGIGSTGNVLTVSGGVPIWAAPAGGGGMTSIASGSLAASATGVNITGIAGTYTHLQLVVYNFTGSADVYLAYRFNDDSSGIYNASTYDWSTANASDIYNLDNAGQAYANGNNPVEGTASGMISIINIFNYASSTMHKQYDILTTGETSSNSHDVGIQAVGRYRSNTAITEIKVLSLFGATFTGGSYILYGVK
jgi:hypothetical protein